MAATPAWTCKKLRGRLSHSDRSSWTARTSFSSCQAICRWLRRLARCLSMSPHRQAAEGEVPCAPMTSKPRPEEPHPALVAFYKEIKRLSFPHGMWSPNVSSDSNVVTVRSFVAAPYLSDVDYSILADGRPLEKVLEPHCGETQDLIDRLDLGSFVTCPTSAVELDAGVLHSDRDTQITLRFGAARLYPVSYYLRDFSGFPTPDQESMKRVSQNDSRLTFNFLGYSLTHQLLAMMNKHFSPDKSKLNYISEMQINPGNLSYPMLEKKSDLRILDWGVGCGRCSRFMEHFLGPRSVYGVDIDPIAMRWLKRTVNLPENYHLITPEHRLPFEGGFFDAIYGISVMTYLSESSQMYWLEELARVLKPGGLAILTTHGLPAFFRSINNGSILYSWLESGFFVDGVNRDLDEGLPEASKQEFYLNVFHTPNYINTTWIRNFGVVEILPAACWGFQDCVVLRRVS